MKGMDMHEQIIMETRVTFPITQGAAHRRRFCLFRLVPNS